MEGSSASVFCRGGRAGAPARGYLAGAPLVLRSRRTGRDLDAGARRARSGGALRVRTKASLLGVGTPEVLVIGVVALLVFGPKGLADAAKSLGKTLRTFQPTIQELKEVSEEFKSTLEDEIGLDEFKSTMQTPAARPYKPAQEAEEPSLEEMRRRSAAEAWASEGAERREGEQAAAEPAPTQFEETLSAPGAEDGEGAAEAETASTSDLSELSLEELQAELERRKSA